MYEIIKTNFLSESTSYQSVKTLAEMYYYYEEMKMKIVQNCCHTFSNVQSSKMLCSVRTGEITWLQLLLLLTNRGHKIFK